MLEANPEELARKGNQIPIEVKPFEIATVRLKNIRINRR